VENRKMPVIPVYDSKNKKIDEKILKDEIFGQEPDSSVIHEVIVWQMAKRRAGTASTLRKDEVRGGGKKPWKQKGTGNARSGSNRSPVWRGGGSVFGPKPRDYSYDIPKKLKKLALCMALSDKCKADRLVIIRDFEIEKIKTKDFITLLSNFDAKKSLVILDEYDNNLILSSRNIPNVKVLPKEGLNTYDIIKYEYLFIKESAIAQIEERLMS
jgi:large subunit ribosomal protein L4